MVRTKSVSAALQFWLGGGIDDIRIEREEDGARLFDPRKGGVRQHQTQLISGHRKAGLERRSFRQMAAGSGEQLGGRRVGRDWIGGDRECKRQLGLARDANIGADKP